MPSESFHFWNGQEKLLNTQLLSDALEFSEIYQNLDIEV